MFERGRKDSDSGAESGGTDLAARPGRSAAGGRSSGEAAVIGRSIQISGDLRGDEDLRIEGDVTGTIELRSSSLTIGKEGRIQANVFAKNIIVDGHVEGDLYGFERVSIRSSAKVLGNVTAPRVGIEDGANFKGAVEMDQEAVDRAFGQTKKHAVAAPHAGATPKVADTQPAGAVKEATAS